MPKRSDVEPDKLTTQILVKQLELVDGSFQPLLECPDPETGADRLEDYGTFGGHEERHFSKDATTLITHSAHQGQSCKDEAARDGVQRHLRRSQPNANQGFSEGMGMIVNPDDDGNAG